MNSDIEVSENTNLIKSRDFEIKTHYLNESQLFKLLICFTLLTFSSFVAYYLNDFNLVKIKSINLQQKSDLDFRSTNSIITEDLNHENPPEFSIMSLVGATPNSNFKACQSQYKRGDFLNLKVKPGCISLFTNDLTLSKSSYFVTFCGCETMGPKKYDFIALQNSQLISKDGTALISYIATGDGASITLYNSADFDSEEKLVMGPNTQISADKIIRDKGTWTNEIYSIILSGR
jgi:hypothetical protein